MSIKAESSKPVFEHDTKIEARKLQVSGRVQGVGFRPFIYNLAIKLAITGWVRNNTGYVEIFCQGPVANLTLFQNKIISEAPTFSRPELKISTTVTPEAFDTFVISASNQSDHPDIHVPPDICVCEKCITELYDSDDHRYRYPFINCTQCGPRFTLINAMPYDRSNTSMAEFNLCPHCQKQYVEPIDRRFHAEPVACADCGPELYFYDKRDTVNGNEKALAACVQLLQDGKVIAVKGIGGYHLMCDANNDEAVLRLRKQKPRPHKPLAVMFPSPIENPAAVVENFVELSSDEKALLLSAARPVVLAASKQNNTLSQFIAPGLNEIGAMLPYSPLHYLLLDAFAGPLVATSANISGEPVLTDNAQVEQRLDHVADAYLHHNRPIIRPADDSVYRTIYKKPRPVRLGRGTAPLEFELPVNIKKPVLAVGGHMKNNIALAWDNRIVISPHIGDMDSLRSIEVFNNTVRDLQSLYNIKTYQIICDAHPGYATSRWAHKTGDNVHKVFHHYAHASAAFDFNQPNSQQLIFTWDGTGYGTDGTLWGGEALLGMPGNWQRVATLKHFRLPGGDKAGREPWRSAVAVCWETNHPWPDFNHQLDMVHQAWQQNINTTVSTAAGRLFDAAAALLGLCTNASFEGQGPMFLEAECGSNVDPVKLPVNKVNGIWTGDWSKLIAMLADDSMSINQRASCFHASMAHIILNQALAIRNETGVTRIGFCGGVFQNRFLTDMVIDKLHQHGFDTCYPEHIPVNDAGLSYGQVIEYATQNVI